MITLGWLLLAFAGEGAALRLMEAGHALHYQHYVSAGSLLREHPLAAAIILVQALLVSGAALRSRRAVAAWVRGFGVWRLAAVAVVFLAGAAVPSRSLPFYAWELSLAVVLQSINLANVILLAAFTPASVTAKLGARLESLPGKFVVACALWVTLVSGMLAVASYQRHPHVADEVVYLYQARYLAAGMLAMPAPDVPEAFDLDLMMYEKSRWYCPVPPGWPMLLAAGVLAGAPWLVNPVLAGINVLLAYVFLRSLYGRRAACLGAALLAISPWNIFMAMNFMNHTETLTAALLCGVGFQYAAKRRAWGWGFLGGAALGAIALIRPLDAAAVGLVLAGWVLLRRPVTLRAAAAAAAGAVLIGGLNLPYNRLITGSWTMTPITAYTDKYYGPKTNALGFGPERGLGWALDPFPGHSPADAAVNAELNTASINSDLFGWSTGSLLLIGVALFWRRLSPADWLMVSVIAAIVGAYSLYWFSGGPDFGARYWFLVLIPCVALTVRGMQAIGRAEVLPAVAALAMMGLLVFVPWRAVDKYRGYLGMEPDILRLARAEKFGNALVLVRGERFPDYESAAIYNPMDLHGSGPVYAWDRSPEVRARVLKAYADRPVWLVDGPTITHQGYKVVRLLSSGQAHENSESILQNSGPGAGRDRVYR